MTDINHVKRIYIQLGFVMLIYILKKPLYRGD